MTTINHINYMKMSINYNIQTRANDRSCLHINCKAVMSIPCFLSMASVAFQLQQHDLFPRNKDGF